MFVASVDPYPATINIALLLARLYLGMMIFTHGYRKFFRGGKIKGTAGWFESIGMKPGKVNAYAAAGSEMGVGTLLTLGFLTPLAAGGLMAVMLVAIVSVHRKNGFMITNSGGGIEYCLGVATMALLVGTLGAGRYSLDNAVGELSHWTATTRFAVTMIVGVGSAAIQLASFYRPVE